MINKKQILKDCYLREEQKLQDIKKAGLLGTRCLVF